VLFSASLKESPEEKKVDIWSTEVPIECRCKITTKYFERLEASSWAGAALAI